MLEPANGRGHEAGLQFGGEPEEAEPFLAAEHLTKRVDPAGAVAQAVAAGEA